MICNNYRHKYIFLLIMKLINDLADKLLPPMQHTKYLLL